jgi:hypothetical protein
MIGWQRPARRVARAADEYGSVAGARGITTLIVLCRPSSNLGGGDGPACPTKGLVLPFVSYGGSSLVVCATAIVILRVAMGALLLPAQACKATSGEGAEDAGSTDGSWRRNGSDAARANAVRKSKAA